MKEFIRKSPKAVSVKTDWTGQAVSDKKIFQCYPVTSSTTIQTDVTGSTWVSYKKQRSIVDLKNSQHLTLPSEEQ